MDCSLPKASQKVQAFLHQHGYATCIQHLSDSTRTAKEAAQTLGCDVAQIAKSIVFTDRNTQRPVVVVASGINQIDVNKVRAVTGIELGKADAEFVRQHLGYVIGGVPPITHDAAIVTLLDKTLQTLPTLWAAAGTPFTVFETSAEMLAALTHGQWLDLYK